MKTITMLEFRKHTRKIISLAKQGQKMTVTYYGKPVMKIGPVTPEKAFPNDPFFNFGFVSDNSAGSLSNKAIDKLVY